MYSIMSSINALNRKLVSSLLLIILNLLLDGHTWGHRVQLHNSNCRRLCILFTHTLKGNTKPRKQYLKSISNNVNL